MSYRPTPRRPRWAPPLPGRVHRGHLGPIGGVKDSAIGQSAAQAKFVWSSRPVRERRHREQGKSTATSTAVNLFVVCLEWVPFWAYTTPTASSFCSVERASTARRSRCHLRVRVPPDPSASGACSGFQAIGLALQKPFGAVAATDRHRRGRVLLGFELASIHNYVFAVRGHSSQAGRNPWTSPSSRSVGRQEGDPGGRLGRRVLYAAVTFIVVPPYWAVFSWRSGVELPHGVEADGSPWVGAEHPKVVLHEYTDYACPHCVVATNELRALLMRHADSLRVVHHNYSRMACRKEMGTHACANARVADCAGEQGKFWEADAWLFEHAPGKANVDLNAASKDLGLGFPQSSPRASRAPTPTSARTRNGG